MNEDRKDEEQPKVPDVLPVLPLRDIVIFPFMIVPLYVSRDRSIKAVDQALAENRMILLAAQKKQDEDDPGPDDIYPVGTAALIMRMLKLPDGRIRVLVQGLSRARIASYDEGLPHLQARIETVGEPDPTEQGSLEVEALMRNVKAALEKSQNLGKPISPEVIVIANNMEEPGRLADLTASNLDLKVEGAQAILEALDPVDRLRRVHELMTKELEVLTMQQEISSQAKGEMDRSQREFFLRQQLKAIQSELGEGNELGEEIAQLRDKAQKAKMPKPVMEEVERQLKKLERMHPDAAETATLPRRTTWSSRRRSGSSTRTTTASGRSRSGSSSTSRCASSRRRRKGRSCASWARRASARRASASPSPVPWGGSSCASPWAGSRTRPRSVGTAAPTWARCPVASSRASTRRAPTTRSS
jgi:ATP-dependent Lon protease